MLDAIVQLLRNGLCCIKNLHLFEKSFLWDASIPPSYYELPEPLNQTTPLEVMISVFQLYALISCTRGGMKTMVESFGKLRRLGRIIEAETTAATKSDDEKKNDGDDKKECSALEQTVNKIVRQSLLQEANNALQGLFGGFLVFCIGCGFVWLVANSWHITSTTWIGGAQGLIYALSVQEVCLIPCLYFMFTGGMGLVKKSKRMQAMIKRMRGQKKLHPTELELEEFELLTSWKPFWESGVELFELLDSSEEQKLVASERVQIKKCLEDLGSKQADGVFDLADDVNAKASLTKMEGYREFLYLVVNTAAFYGYMMGIICFYWQEEASHPDWVRKFLMNMTVADADWRGNMAGDSAWTIEPIVILTSPFLLEMAKSNKKRQAKKLKSE